MNDDIGYASTNVNRFHQVNYELWRFLQGYGPGPTSIDTYQQVMMKGEIGRKPKDVIPETAETPFVTPKGDLTGKLLEQVLQLLLVQQLSPKNSASDTHRVLPNPL
jgi:hypothetical protein